MRNLLLAAALAGLGGLAMADAPASALGLNRAACAAGYHTDRRGDCQSNIPEVSRYCPPGAVYQPFPDGWVCEPAPRGY